MAKMRHLVFTLKGCQYHLLDDEAYIRTTLVNAAVMAQATLLGITSHKFDPQGVTAVALLAESHISIHTWPEKLMAVTVLFLELSPLLPHKDGLSLSGPTELWHFR